MKFARDGIPTIVGCALITALFMYVNWVPSVIFICLTALVVWFYRDPEREISDEPDIFVSPADGKIVEIENTSHPFTGDAVKIGIFMNAFSVHVNRAPCAGTIDYLEYVPGKKIAAFSSKASEVNERFYVGLNTKWGKILLVQIAGLLARRIVCRRRRGEELARGERYGMIKLGSKVDVYLPTNLTLRVKIGEKVFAGKSIIAGVSK